jgi:trehalose 6-phosphate synthase/phosphatase
VLATATSSEETVIIISFKLPIIIEREKEGSFKVVHSKSILFNTLFNLHKKSSPQVKTVWIGWPGIIPKNQSETEQIEALLANQQFNFVPIFPSQDKLHKLFMFHELVIRPLFHNFRTKDSEDIDMQALWSTYIDINK